MVTDTQKKLNIILFSIFSASLLLATLCLLQNVREGIILLSEKLFFKRALNHEKWLEFLFVTAKHCIVIIVPLLAYKLFSIWFSRRVHDSFLNLLRVIACLMVYFLHTSIFTNSRGVPLFTRYYIKVLQTPAWGGMDIFHSFGLPCREKFFRRQVQF